ncbi:unnamed protein product [Rhizoctonia solani]|uniref:Oxidoreductase N-terminal domain-containing protein n=1 Tax=Rhizoctonia solani TaxID=456999 RepID=A0A8H3ADJ2_9AGAM|nr:unnamed protein product [Rhizoctonia solani]
MKDGCVRRNHHHLDTVPLNGGILVKALWISIDPYLRGRLREAHVNLTFLHLLLGKIFGLGIVVILRSEREDFKQGDNPYVLDLSYQHYAVLPPDHPVTPIDKQGLSLSLFPGVLGMPGKTAYYRLNAIGSDEKVEYMKNIGVDVPFNYQKEKSIGIDVPFNYKNEKASDVLAREGPLDDYWDNVGDESLEAAMPGSRRSYCRVGAISSYNRAHYGI